MDKERQDRLRGLMAAGVEQLRQAEVEQVVDDAPVPDVAEQRRRRFSAPEEVGRGGYLTLVQGADGLLDWQLDAGPTASPARYPTRRAARRRLFEAEAIDQMAFTPVAGSQVGEYLRKLDTGFNARYGLYDLDGRRVDAVVPRGRVLLLVHGTFSQCEAMLSQLKSTPEGRELLQAARRAGQPYDQVLLFEHPTLAVGPVLNALDLARAFAGSQCQVDVVCHSRGGLVARWWLEVLSPHLRSGARVVFCGSPLMGTGLASPYRLRTALKLLTNYTAAVRDVSGLAAQAVPMFAVVQGLMVLVASGSAVLSHTPVVDAAVAAVPGLASMSRYGPDGPADAKGKRDFIHGNFELDKLSFGWTAAPATYFAISGNFESEAVGWRFWKAFRGLGTRLADGATDALFSGENDLVVDTESMAHVSPALRIERRLEFGTTSTVHHVNYFEQPRTARFIRECLGF